MSEPTQNEGSSSEDEVCGEAAGPKARGSCPLWTWPCPRHYAATQAERQRAKCLKPEDLSKDEVLRVLKDELRKKGLLDSLRQLVAVQEPHKRWNKATQVREQHYHVLLQMKAGFAHESMRKALADRGMRGFFSFNLLGAAANLRYLLCASAGKLEADLDPDPTCWPCKTRQQLLAIVEAENNALKTRNALKAGEAQPEMNSIKAKKRRSILTFSELTDVVVERNIHTDGKAWEIAKSMKMQGDTVLWDTLGSLASVAATIAKINKAWRSDGAAEGPIRTTSAYPLSAFHMPPEVAAWKAEKPRPTTTLVLSGDGGLHKTEFACALLASMTKSYLFFRNMEGLRDADVYEGQGILYDEGNLRDLEVDAVKNMLDTAHRSEVAGTKYKCALKPSGCVQIICTNHDLQRFLPPEAFTPQHKVAVQRRMCFVHVLEKLGKFAVGGETQSEDVKTGGNSSSSSSSSSTNAPTIAAALAAILSASPGTQQKLVANVIDGSEARRKLKFAAAEEEDPFGHSVDLDAA